MKKLWILVALLVAMTAVTAVVYAEEADLSEVVGFWMNTDDGFVSLEIREDGSGALTDLDDGMGVAIQVKDARSEEYDYAICLGAEDVVQDLTFNAEDDALILYGDDGRTVNYVRDYWYGQPFAFVHKDLSIRYSPETFELAYDEDGSLMMTCKYREGDQDYIHISLVKNTDMATLLEGLALQSGSDKVVPSYGCWDFSEEEAGVVDYIRNEDGVDYDNFFMAIKHGNDCYLVECHSACVDDPEADHEEDLSDLYAETMGSIQVKNEK